MLFGVIRGPVISRGQWGMRVGRLGPRAGSSDYKAGVAPIFNISGDGWTNLTGATGMLVLGLLVPVAFTCATNPWLTPAVST